LASSSPGAAQEPQQQRRPIAPACCSASLPSVPPLPSPRAGIPAAAARRPAPLAWPAPSLHHADRPRPAKDSQPPARAPAVGGRRRGAPGAVPPPPPRTGPGAAPLPGAHARPAPLVALRTNPRLPRLASQCAPCCAGRRQLPPSAAVPRRRAARRPRFGPPVSPSPFCCCPCPSLFRRHSRSARPPARACLRTAARRRPALA
jgi:hypothetical protein